MQHRVQVGWIEWQNVSGVFYDCKIPTKLVIARYPQNWRLQDTHKVGGKFSRTTIRPVMLYGKECWAAKKQHASKMSVTEMRMLRWMSGKTLRYGIRNENICAMVGVKLIEDKIGENRLRWLDISVVDWPMCSWEKWYEVEGDKVRGRPKLPLEAVVWKDVGFVDIIEHDALDKAQWQKQNHVEPQLIGT